MIKKRRGKLEKLVWKVEKSEGIFYDPKKQATLEDLRIESNNFSRWLKTLGRDLSLVIFRIQKQLVWSNFYFNN